MIPPEFFDRDLVRFLDIASRWEKSLPALRHLSACPRLGPCACEAQDHAHTHARGTITRTHVMNGQGALVTRALTWCWTGPNEREPSGISRKKGRNGADVERSKRSREKERKHRYNGKRERSGEIRGNLFARHLRICARERKIHNWKINILIFEFNYYNSNVLN